MTGVRRGPHPRFPERQRIGPWWWAWFAFCALVAVGFLGFVVWAAVRLLDILAAR